MQNVNETLRHQLQIEWQDHFQTRTQTWRTLEIEAALVVGLIGADLRFENLWVTSLVGLVLVVACLSGIGITVHHRNGQIRKFTHIDRIEHALGLHRPGLLDDVHPPRKFKWIDVLNPMRTNTPLFILRMHIAILLFSFIYIGARFAIR